MMGVDLENMRVYVVRPACQRIGLWSQSAENIVLGTGLTESGYAYLDQTIGGPGPGFGFWQMEKATHDDLWTNYLPGQPGALRDTLLQMAGHFPLKFPPVQVLHWNLLYAAAMCRIHYKRVRELLPAAGDYVAMAAYWKRWYNTPAGKGTVEKATPFFKQVV
jgi:hypothetical protein